jgi:hypothetical protein
MRLLLQEREEEVKTHVVGEGRDLRDARRCGERRARNSRVP